MQTGLILVTGASGFVGKWTVLDLLRAGFSVRGTVRSDAKAEAVRAAVAANVGQDALHLLQFVRADLMDDAGWAAAMSGVDAVAHIAAQIVGIEPKDPNEVIRPALEGTERVLRHAQAAGVRRVVMTSSIATVAYGHGHTTGKRTYTEEHFTKLEAMKYTWAYCTGKTQAERKAWELAKGGNLDLTTIHPGAIMGPALDEDTSISLGLVGAILNGKVKARPSNGFSLIDVRDVSTMHVAALQKPESIGQRYLAAGDYVPFPQVAEILREAYPGREISDKNVPDWVIKLVARFVGGSARQIINDIGNEKHFDRTKGEALLGRPLISGRDALLASAESLIRFGLVKAA
jgi:dihydroflavonol-4-reductase